MNAASTQAIVPTDGFVLGIESSCDETAVAVVRHGIVWTNRVATQIPMHQRFGGVVPEIAARNHLLTILPTIELALGDVGIGPKQLRAIAVTNRPGLIGALLVGVQTAKALALAWQVPIIGIDHIQAHVWASQLRPPDQTESVNWPRPKVPFLALAVSGGHSSLYRVDGPGRMQQVGRTLDDAAGEAFDKFARMLELPYPGGPQVDLRAQQGRANAYALPGGMKGRDDFAFSFSGLKTAGRLLIEQIRSQNAVLDDVTVADLCASFQHAAVRQLVSVSVRAAQQLQLQDIVLAGGVAANRGLRQWMNQACAAAGLRCWPVPAAYCTDNGAMVAGLGEALVDQGYSDDAHQLDAVATGQNRRTAASVEASVPRSSS